MASSVACGALLAACANEPMVVESSNPVILLSETEINDAPISSSSTSEPLGQEDPSGAQGGQDAQDASSQTSKLTAYDVGSKEVLSIPVSEDVITFNLNPLAFNDAQISLDEETLAVIREILAVIEQNSTCGFVFFDRDSGKGLAYHADDVVYIASAAKAPLCFYIVQTDAAGAAARQGLIESALMWSDNDAFDALCMAYLSHDYGEWLAGYQVDLDEITWNYYPSMNAKSLASIWTDLYLYTEEAPSDIAWFIDSLGNTSTSFIRDGIDDAATIHNKAGWIVEDGFYSVSDAAYIQDGEHTYIMAIVSDQANSGQAQARIAELAGALYSLRTALNDTRG